MLREISGWSTALSLAAGGALLAAEPTSPADVAGLLLWLDAGDTATVTADDRAGGPTSVGYRGVSEWRDKSPSGKHVGQPNHAARPTLSEDAQNGLHPVSFDGTTQFLTGPAALPAGQGSYTIIALWRPRRNTGVQSVFEQSQTPIAANTRAALLTVGDRYGFNGEGNDRHDLVPFGPDAWRLTCMDIDNARAANVRIWDNGALLSGASGSPKDLNLGTSGVTIGRKLSLDGEYLDGEIAEILVYDWSIAREERVAALGYLDAKWGTDCLGWFHGPDGSVHAFDFEGGTYDGWAVEGTAFGTGPAHGTLPGQMEVSGFVGEGLVNSFLGGDGATGVLTSPPVVIERRYIRFLIGGGMYPEQACIQLIVDGEVVRSATGSNDRPGGSERLDWAQWDVADLVGKTATFRIIDQATEGWGHINIDQIIQTDEKLPVLIDQTRELTVSKPYLNLPVRNGAEKRRLQVIVDGETVRDFVVPLADGEPDYWVFMDLLPFQGKTITLHVERLPEDSGALAAMEQSDAIRGGEDLYHEALRPQFHFTTRRGWNNDPNGLVYHAGEWHLFYQHNPYSVQWDNMHWGHAVSPDLVHWTELPVALYPDRLGTCFSGSAVVDPKNTAGFAQHGETPIVCVYTAAGDPFTQCLAYSLDEGRSWRKYEGNPVLPNIIGANRDPKVIWYAPERKWVMALYLDANDYALLSSPDLKSWERLSTVTIPGTSECPEFLEIPVEGAGGETRWVFYGGSGHYLIGSFDGRTFTAESGPHALNFGNCFYASQTYNNAPDGRRIQIAWGTVGMPAMPFNQMMDLPVELALHSTDEGLRLLANPAREIALLHDSAPWEASGDISPESDVAREVGELLHIVAEFEVGDAPSFGLNVRGVAVTYDVAAGQLTCRDRSAALKPERGRIRLEVLVDRTSVEIFANGGRVYMPMGIIPKAEDRSVEVFSQGGTTRLVSLRAWSLQSAWEQP